MSVVGVFRDEDAARAALHRLDLAGFAPDSVSVVANNVRQAREAAGSFSLTGALVGAIVGVLAGFGFVLLGGDVMRESGAAVVLGILPLVGAGAFIGVLAGRARLFKQREYGRLESAVDRGDALVTIRCDHEECLRATSALREVGAIQVRDEDTAETL